MLNELLGISESQLLGFLLAFFRIAALASVAPILGSSSVPAQLKVFFALFMTITILPLIKVDDSLSSLNLLGMVPLTLKEVVIGLFLGFNAKFIFESFQFAGRLISTQMGLGMANLVDPDNGQPVTPFGNIYSFMAIVFFLSLNGHHFMISALYKSFELAPVHSLSVLHPAAKFKMMTMFNDVFSIGVKLAAPVMVTLFLIEVCMAIMARVVPRMNIFFIGLPVRLGIGMLVVISSFPVFYLFFSDLLSAWKRDMGSILNYF